LCVPEKESVVGQLNSELIVNYSVCTQKVELSDRLDIKKPGKSEQGENGMRSIRNDTSSFGYSPKDEDLRLPEVREMISDPELTRNN
jgi:hypothetical protein